MDTPKEFHKNVTVTVGLIATLMACAFAAGMSYKGFIDNDKEHARIYDFIEAEVGGLRADWERQYEQIIEPHIKKTK